MKRKNTPHYLKKLYLNSCLEEIKAQKPGNVSSKSNIPGLQKNKFFRAAKISSEPLTNINLSIGESIYNACKRCMNELGSNYNLGIILLCAPIIRASLKEFESKKEFLLGLKNIILNIDKKETEYIVKAIKICNPAGINKYNSKGNIMKKNLTNFTFYDLAVMSQDFDRISGCYASNYKEIFNEALPYFRYQRKKKKKFAIERLYLRLLSIKNDSHIQRKFNSSKAKEIRHLSLNFYKKLTNFNDFNEYKNLLWLNNYLKRKHINPGTCADLTVTTLLIDKIMAIVKYSINDTYT